MRIISKFHDYYDGGSIYGIDKSIVYVREQSEIVLPPADERNIKLNKFEAVIGFCGKIYPICKKGDIILHGDDAIKYEIAEIRTYGLFEVKYEVRERRESSYWKGQVQNEHSELENSNLLKSYFLKYKTPVFLIQREKIQKKGYCIHDMHLLLNPSLKDLEFYKRFDTTQTFQEIEMFLSNVLVADHMEVPSRTNEEIGTSKGFDKNSFKNAKNNSRKF